MENYILTEYTDSAEQFSKSLEFLLPGSLVKSRVLSNNFSSEGHGVLSKGFYLGNNKTKNLAELEIINLRSCVFSIPFKGKYTTYVSNKLFSECTPERGCLFLPADSIKYATETSLVNDLIITMSYDEIESLLLKNYNIKSVDISSIEMNKSNSKVKLIYNLILSKMSALKCYPHLGESLHFMSSVKEVAKLFLTEIIADFMQVKIKQKVSPDIKFLKNVEMLIDANPEIYFSIHEIAEKVNTTPRNLQLIFRKHRNYTPMQFLKERKLHRARLAILNSKGESLIKKIAFNAGFTNMSSFSRDYRNLFGELPSSTVELTKNNFF
ncbi:helix-turn-helix domain-containing protein [uncultured Eudoraea sp.]|uniref:helix-turn-helix domain-containing protein n=1 Tax=uncultured Eudoraea sp. TaxID=1035614 RepID=UPI0026033C1C|nr:helix-turn-helix domain-containing protein [uncultured Eudoraea sp.]